MVDGFLKIRFYLLGVYHIVNNECREKEIKYRFNERTNRKYLLSILTYNEHGV